MTKWRRVMLDTGVLADHLLGRGEATRLLALMAERGLRPMCASSSLHDASHLCAAVIRRRVEPNPQSTAQRAMRRILASRAAWESVSRIMDLCDVIEVGHGSYAEALRLRGRHEDVGGALTVVVARQTGMDVLVTTDGALVRSFPELCVSVREMVEHLSPQR